MCAGEGCFVSKVAAFLTLKHLDVTRLPVKPLIPNCRALKLLAANCLRPKQLAANCLPVRLLASHRLFVKQFTCAVRGSNWAREVVCSSTGEVNSSAAKLLVVNSSAAKLLVVNSFLACQLTWSCLLR